MKVEFIELTISKEIQAQIEMQEFVKTKLRESYQGLNLSKSLL